MLAFVLRHTGVTALFSFYRYFQFNLPRTVTAAGVALLAGIAAIRLFWLGGHFLVPDPPTYITVYNALVAAAALVAVAALVAPGYLATRAGWLLGSMVGLATVAMYLVSRTGGLPGLPRLVGWWDYPLGTIALGLEAGFVAMYASIVTGMTVARPQRREWHD